MTMPLSNETEAAEFMRSEMRRLHEETHPERQEGEFTAQEYADANALTYDRASDELEYMVRVGKIIKSPKRYIRSHLQVVYKIAVTAN